MIRRGLSVCRRDGEKSYHRGTEKKWRKASHAPCARTAISLEDSLIVGVEGGR